MSRQVNTATPSDSHREIFVKRLNQALGNTTSEAFSRRIDRTLRTVQRWRSGDSAPSGIDLVAIARELDREPGWFYEPDEAAA